MPINTENSCHSNKQTKQSSYIFGCRPLTGAVRLLSDRSGSEDVLSSLVRVLLEVLVEQLAQLGDLVLEGWWWRSSSSWG